ncbi:hypothetical protein D3C73_1428340 [compost metagenome]
MNAITRAFPRWAHRVIRIEVVAGTITIAMEGGVIALPDALIDCAVKFASQLNFINTG